MKIKLLYLLLFASLSSYAQYTTIPDVNFENKLIALGIDSGVADGKVPTANVDKLTSLDVSSSSISDLTGIQDFVVLTNLNCSRNELTTLNIYKNVALNYLHCYFNQLTSLDISKNVLLTELICSYNQLTSLDVSNNLDLNLLNCSANKLISLDVSKNVALTYFACYSNQLTTINVSKNTALTTFVCGQNQLTSLDVSNDLILIDLSCNGNQLTALDVSKNVALESLHCSINQLTTIDVSKNVALNTFGCFENQLTTLDVSQNAALTFLQCSDNQLTTLDLSKNKKLEVVYLEFNPLTSLNIQNGNNKNFILPSLTGKATAAKLYCSFTNNEKLSCIKVDDEAYSNTNWSNIKDATATYSSTCSKLGIEDSVFDKVAIYPNPTKGELHIDNIVLEKATVYDALGKLVKTTSFTSGANDNTMHLEGFPSGIYYIYLESERANTAKKIIVK